MDKSSRYESTIVSQAMEISDLRQRLESSEYSSGFWMGRCNELEAKIKETPEGAVTPSSEIDG